MYGVDRVSNLDGRVVQQRTGGSSKCPEERQSMYGQQRVTQEPPTCRARCVCPRHRLRLRHRHRLRRHLRRTPDLRRVHARPHVLAHPRTHRVRVPILPYSLACDLPLWSCSTPACPAVPGAAQRLPPFPRSRPCTAIAKCGGLLRIMWSPPFEPLENRPTRSRAKNANSVFFGENNCTSK